MVDVSKELASVQHVIDAKQVEVRQRRSHTKEPVALDSALRSTGIDYLEKISELPESEEQREINRKGLQGVKARLAK